MLLPVLTAYAQGRYTQIWNVNSFELKINEKVSFGVTEKISYLPEAGSLSQKSGDLFIKRHLADWFEMGFSGRLVWAKQENRWLVEQRPILFSKLSTKWRNLDLDFANRLEYRMYKGLDDYFRYRQMFLLEMPHLFDISWFNIYLAEESFFRFNDKQFHLIRFHSGTKIRYSRTFEMKFYYVLEKNRKPASWNTSDILGLNLNMDF